MKKFIFWDKQIILVTIHFLDAYQNKNSCSKSDEILNLYMLRLISTAENLFSSDNYEN